MDKAILHATKVKETASTNYSTKQRKPDLSVLCAMANIIIFFFKTTKISYHPVRCVKSTVCCGHHNYLCMRCGSLCWIEEHTKVEHYYKMTDKPLCYMCTKKLLRLYIFILRDLQYTNAKLRQTPARRSGTGSQ